VIILETEKPIKRINELENESIKSPEFDNDIYFKQPNELKGTEIEHLIAKLLEDEKNIKFNKARRTYKKKRLELEAELEKRRINNVR